MLSLCHGNPQLPAPPSLWTMIERYFVRVRLASRGEGGEGALSVEVKGTYVPLLGESQTQVLAGVLGILQ